MAAERARSNTAILLSVLFGLSGLLGLSALGRAEAPAAALQTDTAGDGIHLKQIMADPDWLGRAPESPYWAADSSRIYFERKREGEDLADLFAIELDGAVDLDGNVEKIEDVERSAADSAVDIGSGAWSADRKQRVEVRHGDLFWRDFTSGETRQLTRTRAAEQRPRFLADGRSIVFERDGTLFVRDLETGLESQPAHLVLEDDPAPPKEPGESASYLVRHQQRYFAYLRRQAAAREGEKEREDEARRHDPARVPPAWYLGDGLQVVSQRLSPAGDLLLVVVRPADCDNPAKCSADPQDKMPIWVTDDGYVDIQDLRIKVGEETPIDEKLILLDLANFTRHDIDLTQLPGILDDPLADLKAAEAARRAEAGIEPLKTDGESDEHKARPVEIEGVEWSRDGRYAAIQFHSYDNKDRWLAVLDREEREAPVLHTVERLSDPEGWINWSFNQYGWLGNTHQLYFLSEATGYSHLYVHDVKDGKTTALTEGRYVVSDPQPSPDLRFIYYAANVEHPGHYNVYRVALANGRSERLSSLGGLTDFLLSPDGERLLLRHSQTLHPPELYVQAAKPGAEATRLTRTTSEAFLAQPWTPPEIVEVPSTHQDRPVYSRLYLPPEGHEKRDAAGKRPAVLFVHGAGYLQNAHHGWSAYFREFMFHSLLTRHGYVVLDMDYRGSAGYGRDWRTAIYRHMGEPELRDLQDGIAWLVENYDVDPERVGVYGGSYGGFMTMMALFKEPDLFAAGAALRPVTDWAHYNHPYTSNILNTPAVDPEAFRRSSPIEFAEGLDKPLLICAPMLDDNVFFMDTVRLVQHLIELEKEDFEVAIYPVEPHGFVQPSSWLDEYRRIFKLFENHLWP